ncbi:MAG: molybdopterin-binding protein [Pseudomonadota bacterium]
MAERTAAILAIGDELLSGRTRDINVHRLGGWLTERAVALKEARIVCDNVDLIATALNELRERYDYVFTSGGIGPTHDDMTVDGVAQAFCVDVIENEAALGRIKAWYDKMDQELTPARRRMARMPAGAVLIANPVTGAPGVRIGNVYVMAGVPRIFAAMLDAVATEILPGERIYARAVTAPGLPESAIADQLREIQAALNGVAIGSYPIDGDEKGVTIVARSANPETVEAAIETVAAAMRAHGVTPTPGDHADGREAR